MPKPARNPELDAALASNAAALAQRETFTAAVSALGGARSAARLIAISERSMARLLSAEAPLHDGFLRDIARELIAHADLCRKLERRLSPAFAANLLPGAAKEDGRRLRHQQGR